MSNYVFPTLPGVTWDISKSPEFSTKIQTSASGAETATAYWSYPKWAFSLKYDLLRSGAYNELEQLVGLFLKCRGNFDTFLYTDPDDNSVTGQTIGTGDGVSTYFQLGRTYGGFFEPFYDITGTVRVYKNGTLQNPSTYTISTIGLISFNTAPATGAVITADFGFQYRCRFLHDSCEFNQFAKSLWEAKKVEFRSVLYAAPKLPAILPA